MMSNDLTPEEYAAVIHVVQAAHVSPTIALTEQAGGFTLEQKLAAMTAQPKLRALQSIASHVYEPVPFEVGNEYVTLSGEMVKVVERGMHSQNHGLVRGSDNMWRYCINGPDLGRVTGAPSDHPANFTPLYRKVIAS